MKKSRFLAWTLALVALLVGTSVLAQSSRGVGTVRSLKGELRADGARLVEGARIGAGRLNSASGAQALLLFDDGMQVTLDENSVLRIVNFEPATAGGGNIVLDLLGGAARIVTGDVVRRDPRQFSLRTTDASLGVYEPSDLTVAVVDGTYVTVTRGSVSVANAGFELGVPANATAAVRNRGAYPVGIASSQLPPKARAALARLGEIPQPRETTAMVAPPAAPAQGTATAATVAAPVTRFWLGASAGRSHIDRDAVSKLIDSGTVDESSTGYKLYAGYQLHRYVAAEVAYVDLGKLSYEGTFAGAPITGGELKLSGVDLSALATLPVGTRLKLFAKAGLFFWQAEASDSGNGGGAFSAKSSGRKPSFGLGASYAVYGPLALRFEVESFQFGDHHAQLVSAGLTYNF